MNSMCLVEMMRGKVSRIMIQQLTGCEVGGVPDSFQAEG